MMYREDLIYMEAKELEDLLQRIDKHIDELDKQINKYGYAFIEDRLQQEKLQRAEVLAAFEDKLIQDVVKRWKTEDGLVNTSLSQKEIIAIIHHTKYDKLDNAEQELLLSINQILNYDTEKAEVVADVFRTFCHITPLSQNNTGNKPFHFAGFQISCDIPKKFADAINLRADEIRLGHTTVKQKADEIYEKLMK